MLSRPILKASRLTTEKQELTGRENIKYVDPKRIYHYGYKIFLYIGKIEEIFGERIAKSKKIRKAKIRDILNKIMHTFDMKEDFDEDAIVDDFIAKTEAKLREYIAEIQEMKSSPIETITISKTKRKKEDSQEKAIRMKVDISPPKKKEVDPLENQMEFLADLMKSTIDPSKNSTITVRQVEAKFKDAQKKDQEAIKKDLAEKERQQKTEKRRRIIEMNKEIRDDLTILMERAGI